MKITKSHFLRTVSALLLTLSLVSSTHADPPALPETPVGNIAGQFLAAVNSDHPDAIEQFVTTRITEEPWLQMTRPKYLSMLRKMREQSGDLRVERILMADGKNIRLMIASDKANRKVGLEIVLPAEGSTQACHIWIHHFPPSVQIFLPKGKVSEAEQPAAIEKFLDESSRAGIHSGAVLVAKGGSILVDKAWGLAHSTKKTPNSTRMQYGTASVGKMFTAVAIAQLHQAGKLEYTDTIARHLPDYPHTEAARKVQVQHLLAHTAGIADPFDSPKFANSKNYKVQTDWFETFADKPLAFAPGARHEYSNGGYIVLAAIVEKISGLTFSQYVKQFIFEPAGMTHTGLTTACQTLPVSVPHAVTIVEDPLGVHGPQPKADLKEAEDGVGMGGWTSTTRDLYNFARALRTNKLLSPSHTGEITTGKVKFIPPPMDVKYCYGFYEMPVGPDRLVGHSGGGGDLGLGADVEILWDSEYIIVVLSNQGVEEARRTAHSIARFLAAQ